jgi:hypothetical protein
MTTTQADFTGKHKLQHSSLLLSIKGFIQNLGSAVIWVIYLLDVISKLLYVCDNLYTIIDTFQAFTELTAALSNGKSVDAAKEELVEKLVRFCSLQDGTDQAESCLCFRMHRSGSCCSFKYY